VIEVIHAGNDVDPPGLATTETLTQNVNLNYFSEAVSSEVKARLADADSWRITGYSELSTFLAVDHSPAIAGTAAHRRNPNYDMCYLP
jgi:hypothetical protein